MSMTKINAILDEYILPGFIDAHIHIERSFFYSIKLYAFGSST
ncbi:hypothetical protein [Borreliella burgdorferi]|nr:hypothetical protein [Borreliella burgdorferi]